MRVTNSTSSKKEQGRGKVIFKQLVSYAKIIKHCQILQIKQMYHHIHIQTSKRKLPTHDRKFVHSQKVHFAQATR